MTRFTLQPCKVRQSWLVPSKDEPVVLGWKDLCARLAPSGEHRALLILRGLQAGAFVGLMQGPRGPTNFLLLNLDRSGSLEHLASRDPSLPTRIVEVYRVEEAVWKDRLTEENPS